MGIVFKGDGGRSAAHAGRRFVDLVHGGEPCVQQPDARRRLFAESVRACSGSRGADVSASSPPNLASPSLADEHEQTRRIEEISRAAETAVSEADASS